MYGKSETYQRDLENALRGTIHIEALFHKSILITGATGLIGSFLTDLLLYANRTRDAGIRIYALARDERRLRGRFAFAADAEGLRLLVQDVTEPPRLPEPVDYMIHAAGDGYPAAFRTHPVETMTPALFGTYRLLEYAREHAVEKPLRQFLFVSSGEVYGNMTGVCRAFAENDCGDADSMQVRSCYPMAKRCAETLCVSFWEQYRIPVVIARPGHVYGACTTAHDNRATVQFLHSASAGEDIILHSAGEQLRSYTYVADCASALLTVLLNGETGTTYNIANRESRVTIAEFAAILAKESGVGCMRKEPDETGKKELTPIARAVLDAARLEGLGWKGQYDIRRGIRAMLAAEKYRKGVGLSCIVGRDDR